MTKNISEMATKQLVEIVENSTTDDGRIAPDYANSFSLKSAIDELVERAYMYEDLCR